ncbi:hypothetical protein [Streptomyces cinerochromogenes]|uniref:hypothetical protein n=1 Tax=Streptomyces cinerochromogenes TaxID=66422 RepID=UPI0033A8A6D5
MPQHQNPLPPRVDSSAVPVGWPEDFLRHRSGDGCPMCVNDSAFGNVVPHLHSHVCPRYAGNADRAPGGPLPWQFLGGGRPDEGRLEQDAAALRALLGDA